MIHRNKFKSVNIIVNYLPEQRSKLYIILLMKFYKPLENSSALLDNSESSMSSNRSFLHLV